MLSKNEVSTSLDGDRFAIIFHDEGTGWLEGAPDGNRNITAARKAFRNLAGPRQRIDSFYCDNAGELTKAADELELVNPTSTPFLSKSNSRAERKIGHVKEDQNRVFRGWNALRYVEPCHDSLLRRP